VLRHADALDFLRHAEPLEQWQIERQQRFADVETGVALLFQQHDIAPALRQQRSHGRAGRTGTDNSHFARVFKHMVGSASVTEYDLAGLTSISSCGL
jgi:hypothetical protein